MEPQATPSELIRSLEEAKFVEMAGCSPKAVRETIFTRLGVKAKPMPKTKFAKPGAKNEERLHALRETLQEVDDDEVAEELLRNYFLRRRELLAAALDYMKIPHEDGLTSSELDAFAKLTEAQAQKMLDKLSEDHDSFDVLLYLRFMKAPV